MNENQDTCIEANNHDEKDILAMLEAMIFVSKDPLSILQMKEFLHTVQVQIPTSQIKKIIEELMIIWADENRKYGRGLTLQKIAGGYVFTSSPKISFVLKKIAMTKPLELTKAQMEVLSIVAYRQPITKVDVDEIRGVDSSYAVKRLMQLKLLKILGKSEGIGRPLLYGTSKFFLEFFSLNSLNDLPTLKQFEALGQDDMSENVDPSSLPNVNLKDLFRENENGSMFSEDVKKLSIEALKSLDDALLRIDVMEKKLR
jgi:segregation and condensation protein B